MVSIVAAVITTKLAFGQARCGHPYGDYVVIDVRWEDPIGGLAVRMGPSSAETKLGTIPADGTGIGVDVEGCTQSGWCRVKYRCLNGWSLLARYLALRSRRLQRVTQVSATDPQGLNVHSGPHYTFPVRNHISYNSSDVIKHVCQPSPKDGSEWCLVTQNDRSGWVASRFLAPGDSPNPPPPSRGDPGPPPPPSRGDPGPPAPPPVTPPPPNSRACLLFPNLC
jgi:uncharacterized protein YraI